MSWWIEARIGRSGDTIQTISYLGAPDVRYGVMFLAAMKCGYKVNLPAPASGAILLFLLLVVPVELTIVTWASTTFASCTA
jgi:hypothetical protein